jgi:hypothetical protein
MARLFDRRTAHTSRQREDVAERHDDARQQPVNPRDNNWAVDETDHTVIDEGMQHDRYGGFHFGAAFFGWLVSSGLSVILLALLAAAGAAVALTQTKSATGTVLNSIGTVGLVSGIVFVVVMAIAYYAGGYVAGRMSRFDGARQGVGVWILGVLATLVLAALGATLGAQYNILGQLNLPHLPVSGDAFTTGGALASLATLLMTLLGAVLGGKAGTHYHRKVDAAGMVESDDNRSWAARHFGRGHGSHAHSH